MLTGAGLGDDAGLAHLPRQECLAQNIVDLVRTGVVQVFPLEEDPCATGMFGQPRRFVQRRRPAAVVPLQPVELIEERLVAAGLLIGRGDLFDHRHQRLGNQPAPVGTEMAQCVGIVNGGFSNACAGTGQFGPREIRHQSAFSCKRLIAWFSEPVSGRTGAYRR